MSKFEMPFDGFPIAHLTAWLKQQFEWEEGRAEAMDAILAYVRYDPEAIDRGLSWWEMYDRGRALPVKE